ncbi:hypothetical protein [Nocardia sp. GAS34]|uniref:hypothetical protein n=1 Tax=unclassified Nocardia TaxID=2637762 RepID=UPI003D1CBCAA
MGSWILSGAILRLIGWRATARSRSATLVLALLCGAAVYPIGVILTGFVLVRAIDATHRH